MGVENTLDSRKEWIDALAPDLWFKLDLLGRGESWVLEDEAFFVSLERLMNRIGSDVNYLSRLYDSDRFPTLVKALAYMPADMMIRVCRLAPPQTHFEVSLINWCVARIRTVEHRPYCNVLISRFDYLFQQDLNNRIFGRHTRNRVSQILQSI